jgi:hypothetical protein
VSPLDSNEVVSGNIGSNFILNKKVSFLKVEKELIDPFRPLGAGGFGTSNIQSQLFD